MEVSAKKRWMKIAVLVSLVLMLACLIGLFYFLFTGNGAGIGACVVLQLLLGFSSVQMLKKKEA